MKRMTNDEYREKIATLGMSQVAAAKFLDIAERTSRRYALGVSPIPGAVAILLRTMMRKKLAPDDILEIANSGGDVTEKRKRTAAYVLKQMRKRGATLHASYEKDQWFLSGDQCPLASNVGQTVSRDPHVCGVGDALFEGERCQTYRFVE